MANNLLHTEMTRKQFILFGTLAVGSVFGLVGIIKQLQSHAATATATLEPEDGTKSSTLSVVTDTTASNNTAIKFKTPAAPTTRDSLVPGQYIPGPEFTPNSVGLINPGATFTFQDGTEETLGGRVFRPGTSYKDHTFENVIFRCCVVPAATAGTLIFKNCWFVGNNPDLLQSQRDNNASGWTEASGITLFSTAVAKFYDCMFDPGWWKQNGLANRLSTQWSAGVRGGNFELYRCHVRGWTDSFNFNGTTGQGSTQHVLVHASRLGPCYYANQEPTTAYYAPQSGPDARGGATHSDSFQFNVGANVEIRYSYLGGPHTLAGEGRSFDPGPIGAVATDSYNAALMVQQETGNLVDGIYIHDNWLAGGAATLNLHYAKENTLPAPGLVDGRIGNRIVNNRFMKRAGANQNGYNILKSPEMQTDLSGNVDWDPAGSINGTGVATVISRG